MVVAILGAVAVEASQSTHEDWQKEAHKLALQGKAEQADAIRRTILKETPVPWPVADEARVTELLLKVFREQFPGGKPKSQLYEIATCHDDPVLAAWLAQEAKFDEARRFTWQCTSTLLPCRESKAAAKASKSCSVGLLKRMGMLVNAKPWR